MKETNRNPKISLLISTVVLFGILSVFIGCGFFGHDNNPPSIETLTDETIADRLQVIAVLA